MDGQVSDSDKIRIVSDFIKHVPPGEFNEVFNDVRKLLKNDTLLKNGASDAFAHYNKDQLTPVRIEGSEHNCVISDHNDLGGNRFFDPRSKRSFKYDHLRKESSDYQDMDPDSNAETWRAALDIETLAYTANHFRHGVCSVFSKSQNGFITLTICIEDHQFQPKNYWNGRWRSQWQITFQPNGNNAAELNGILRAQVHYYEEGNVQLVPSKDCRESIIVSNEQQMAKQIIALIEEAENEYQMSISENYQTMSDTTFKAMRRQLPITRTLSTSEESYATNERELLAIVWALKSLKQYLYCVTKLFIYTDHQPLTFSVSDKNPNSKIKRWKAFIEEYSPIVCYKPGKENVVADALSRQFLNNLSNSSISSSLQAFGSEESLTEVVSN